MTDREKLTNIVCCAIQTECVGHCNHSPCIGVKNVVDALLSNGVTVQPVTDNDVGYKWISVKDRLPDIERDYGEHVYSDDLLVATPDGLCVAYYCHTAKQWIDALFQDEIIEASYWQPLPEPPKEGDNA